MHIVCRPCVCLSIWLLFIYACHQHHEMDHAHHTDHEASTIKGQPSRETLAMIDSIQKAQMQVDPTKVTITLCAQRAELYKKKIEISTGLEKANLMVMYGFEELKAGNTQQAMEAFQDVLTFVAP